MDHHEGPSDAKLSTDHVRWVMLRQLADGVRQQEPNWEIPGQRCHSVNRSQKERRGGSDAAPASQAPHFQLPHAGSCGLKLPVGFVRRMLQHILTGAFCFVLLACDEAGVQSYVVPKGSESIAEATPKSPTAVDRGTTAPAGENSAPLTATSPGWVVPEGWRESADKSPMRLVTFLAAGGAQDVTIAVTRFPGDVGGRLANINRWRGQMQLPPVTEAELEPMLVKFSQPGFDGYFVHIKGESSHLMAAGLHESAANRTWFVRATTNDADAQRIQQEILAFAKSFGTAPHLEHDAVGGSGR